MTLIESFFLGIVQGVTEFLPISSSGHLVIFQHLLGVDEPSLTFEIFLHVATLVAVVIFFRRRIFKLSLQDARFLVIGTIPAVVIGLLFKDAVESLFSSLSVVSVTLMVTGGINFFVDRKLNGKNGSRESSGNLSNKAAFLIGLCQAAAITPGISRSGSTLAGGIWQKLSREDAFTFSFLLSIPAVLGASVLQFLDVWKSPDFSFDWGLYAAGGLAAFVTGMLSLKLLQYVVRHARMEVFGWYCLSLGGLLVVGQLLGWL